MRTLAIFLFACVLNLIYAQQKTASLPKDGNELLDACSVVVDAADNPSSITSLSNERFNYKMRQLSWCSGYLEATKDCYIQNSVNAGCGCYL
jgi:hypothetical protein